MYHFGGRRVLLQRMRGSSERAGGRLDSVCKKKARKILG